MLRGLFRKLKTLLLSSEVLLLKDRLCAVYATLYLFNLWLEDVLSAIVVVLDDAPEVGAALERFVGLRSVGADIRCSCSCISCGNVPATSLFIKTIIMAKCISPLSLRQGGKRISVPCGKCNYCLANKRSDLCFRLSNELKDASTALFLTMTYDDSKLPRSESTGFPTLVKKDVQDFNKRLRFAQSEVSPDKIRFYACGEYGTRTNRPHYHGIYFNILPQVQQRIEAIWKNGHVVLGSVSPASIAYVAKYVINRDVDISQYDIQAPFALMSTKPGLGYRYVEKMMEYHRRTMLPYATIENGVKVRLPRYYKDKLFTTKEKEKFKEQFLEQEVVDYHAEIERLKEFHPDPYWYDEEKSRFHHEEIRTKLNKFDKF